ncbi:2,3,4,5-tetrahydropyridine-2,6-dicarboxylate N-succinyltransferase, partial [Mesonia mobilis]|uniref:2,3,4,5-tetrahydropyridine-2,6-dicarboxylate N-succinyltransferase n=1 Tax=Mesonia mobilis TaxID=369791 RepID=UPI0026F0A7F9
MEDLKNIILEAWDNRELLKEDKTQQAIRQVINLIDAGELRTAEPTADGWQVNEWVKKGVVLYFPIQKMETLEAGIFEYHDKMPLKTGYKEKGIRVVPNAVARHGAYISSGVIMMPSYVNIGAYVDEGTMVDTWATVGSCAQIGKNVKFGAGSGIEGVLEPAGRLASIVEDHVKIGA